MFFDKCDQRNTMMQSILAFDKVGQTGLAGFGWVSPSKNYFIRSSSK